jgi:hypothetical protein
VTETSAGRAGVELLKGEGSSTSFGIVGSTFLDVLDVLHDDKSVLESGHLAGAGIDVFGAEPPPPDHPLLRVRASGPGAGAAPRRGPCSTTWPTWPAMRSGTSSAGWRAKRSRRRTSSRRTPRRDGRSEVIDMPILSSWLP